MRKLFARAVWAIVIVMGLPAAWLSIFGDVGYAPTRIPAAYIFGGADGFEVRSNFDTGWTLSAYPHPTFSGRLVEAGSYDCQLAGPSTVMVQPSWWKDGIVKGPVTGPVIATFVLDMKEGDWIDSPMSSTRTLEGKLPPFFGPGWSPIAGTKRWSRDFSSICLKPEVVEFMPAKRSDAGQLKGVVYCRVSLDSDTLTAIDFDEQAVEHDIPFAARLWRGSCYRRQANATQANLGMNQAEGVGHVASPIRMAAQPATDSSILLPPPTTTAPLNSTPTLPPLRASPPPYNICIVGGGGGVDARCGVEANTCTTSFDGRDVACGGNANVCIYSADSEDVACGGRAFGCIYNRSGTLKACGGGQYTPD